MTIGLELDLTKDDGLYGPAKPLWAHVRTDRVRSERGYVPAEPESKFLVWNDALARHFFFAEMASRPVFLFVSDGVIDVIGRSIGSTVDEFIKAVLEGPSWLSTRDVGLCQKALLTAHSWRTRNLQYPPYIAYLALFVYAAGLTGDYPEYAYYPRLRHLIGMPQGSTIPGFDRMLTLWDDLEQWSVIDKRGQLGLFEARIVGNWIHVGLPLAQTILTAEERAALPSIFAAAYLDPVAIPTNAELADILRRNGSGDFRRRTLALLRSPSEEMHSVLLDTVADELINWDGVGAESSDRDQVTRGHSALKICLELEPLSGRCLSYLRAALPEKECSEYELRTRSEANDGVVRCEEDIPGWSLPLQDAATNAYFDVSALDWTSALSFVDAEEYLLFRLPGRSVRVFTNGESLGLPGLVESHSLPGNAPFYIACDEAAREQVSHWLATECENARSVHCVSGLSDRWSLWSVGRANNDSIVRSTFPWLRLPDRVRLRLRGGVRVSGANDYLWFAPPTIEVVGFTGVEHLFVDGALHEISELGIANVVLDAAQERRVLIEVRKGESVVARKAIYVVNSVDIADSQSTFFDKWGQLSTSAEPRASGASVIGVDSHGGFRYRFPFESCGEAKGSRFFLIGERPGEILLWPDDAIPKDWQPTWAVRDALVSQALYTASDDERGGIDMAATPRLVRHWKEVIWHRRYRVSSPRFQTLRRRWQKLQKVARDV